MGSGAARTWRSDRVSPGAVAVVVALLGALLVVSPSAPAAPSGSSAAWTIETVAGDGPHRFLVDSFGGDGGPATSAQLFFPTGVAVDDAGSAFIADNSNNRVRKVDTGGVITTVAGNGSGGFRGGFSGDGGPATGAQLSRPTDVAVDQAGNVYIADANNRRIRKVDTDGIITTVAGGGTGGDGEPATEAALGTARAVAVDPVGNLHIADGNRIRKVDTDGVITTVAGTGVGGFSGDGGPATAAQLNSPRGMAFDAAGVLYIADSYNNRIRKVDTAGVITTVAGDGSGGFDGSGGKGDGGAATSASLYHPLGVAVQGSGNLFIAEYASDTIRRVDSSGRIDTVAGMGSRGLLGDGGFAPLALLNQPFSLALNPSGDLYIADAENDRIRRLGTSYLWIDASPEPTTQGQDFTYTLSVSGLPSAATGVTLTDTLPAEVAFKSVTTSQGSCAESNRTVSCDLGSLAPGDAAHVQVTVTALRAGIIANTATVSANEADAVPGHRSVTSQVRVSSAECGKVVTETTTLSADIGPCHGNGVIIGTDGITFDLAGHRIFGFPGPASGAAAGIRLPQRTGVTVKNGRVSDFDAGVVAIGGKANTVTGMVVRDNVGPNEPFDAELGDGIYLFGSAENVVSNNIVVGNGIFDGIGVWGKGADANTIENNLVENTVGSADGDAAGQGIIVNGADFDASVVRRNLVRANTVRGNASGGISNVNHVGGTVENNVVEGNGRTNNAGNGIGVQKGPSFSGPMSMTVRNNEVHGNFEHGIVVTEGSTGNTISDNDAADNAVHPFDRSVRDLKDENAACGTEDNLRSRRKAPNFWSGNTWGSGGFDPACTTNEGRGPANVPTTTTDANATADDSHPARRPPSA